MAPLASFPEVLCQLWAAVAPSLPVVLVVVGWIVTHSLSLRAQRNGLRNQIVDRARLEVVDGLRAYQDWLQSRMALLVSIQSGVALERDGMTIGWTEHFNRVGKALESSDATYRWQLRFEEYEVLFPEAMQVVAAIATRQRDVFSATSTIHNKLGIVAIVSATVRGDNADLALMANAATALIVDQIALTEDLRIWLQNKTLGELMGRQVPPRVPRDISGPRLTAGKNGQLTIVEAP